MWAKENLYKDYDIINKEMIKKYKISTPEKALKYLSRTSEGTLSILNMKYLDEFIDKLSSVDIEEEQNLIKRCKK